MKMKKRFLGILLSLSLVLGLMPGMSLTAYAGLPGDSDHGVEVGDQTMLQDAVTGVSLDKTTAQTIDVDGKVAFTATVTPGDATDKTVKWSVSGTNADAVKLYTDEACTTEVGTDATSTLTVYAKGNSAGSATVTATSNADSTKSASCDVTVNEAVSNNPYANLLNTTTVVKFDNKDWYLIENNSTAANAGTVTLLSKECVQESAYNDDDFVAYDNNPTIKGVVDTWYSSNITANAKTAVNGNGMFLLTTAQANAITNAEVRTCSQYPGTEGKAWWLCSPGSDMPDRWAAYVGIRGDVYGGGDPAGFEHGVRPALQLDLSKVTFSSVNLSGGANATISEGTATQNYFDVGNTRGAMTTVTYTANANYKFPESSELYKTTNGITVTRTSDTVITVSGTPTETATSIAVPDAVKAEPSQLTLNVGENGSVVMSSGTYGNCSGTSLDVSIETDLTGTMNVGTDNFINVNEGASINVLSGGKVSFYPAANNTGTITAVPADRYTFAGWYNGETLYSENAGLEYKNISEDLDLTAQFEADTYNVTITPGSNMTKTETSGAESQNVSGAMTDVVYTANDGYYFPENYSVEAVNGISVTRNSYTQITVSGTPTADAAIALTAPTAKTTPDTPTTAAATDCTTADNNDGKLTGVTAEMEYKKSDATEWTAGTGNDITGLVPGTYYVRVKATDTTNASGNQELTIADYLSVTKTAAKNDLDTLQSGKNQNDYDAADWTTLTQAITDGKTAIDNATTIDGVNTAKSNAEAAVNAVKTKAQKALENAKTTAKNDLDTLQSGKNQNDYDAADWTTLTQAITDGKIAIDNATTLDAVNTAKTNAETAANAVKTKEQKAAEALVAAKTSAKDALDNLKSGKTQSDYDDEDWTALTQAITNGKTAIDAAETIDAVNTAKTNAENAVNSIKTKAQKAAETLSQAKTAAKGELDSLLNNKTQSDYDAEDWTAITQAISSGKTAIDNAETTVAVDTAKNTAISAVSAVKTKAQKAAEALATAKISAKAELDNLQNSKHQDDYDAEEWTALTKAVTDGKSAIDNAASIGTVNAARDAAADAVNAVKTKAQKAADAAAAKAVTDKIDALPAAGKVTTSDKAAIEAARKAYDALTADQKAKVSADILKKLIDAENALAEAEKKAVTSVTVNTKTVNAKAVNAAIAKAGGSSKYVTTIVLGKKVKKISKGAFKNYKKAKTLVVKTKKLKKASVKKSLKGSKISKVKVKVSKKKKANKKYVKKYKKIFTKKNAGKKVNVSL